MNRSASNKTERRILNLQASDVTLLKELGRGNYGKVFLAHINDRQLGIGINCAAKVINEPYDESSNNLADGDVGASNELHALKNELSIYERLHPNHPSFPKLIGIVRDDDNFMLITEYVEGGDLLKFLRSKARGGLFIEQTLNNFDNNIQAQKDTQSAPVGSITSSTLVYIALQIANALKYLINDLNILHRDIAARNILITGDFVIKIADFGLAREGYYEQPSRMALPFLNLALETLQTCKFTPKSEVWQFGVLLFEIFSLGKRPYCDLFTKYAVVKPCDKLVEFLEGGGRLLPPKGMPESIQRMMAKCFLENPDERPTFNSITETLHNLLKLVSPELALIVDASSHLDDEPSNPLKFIKHSYKGGYLQPRSNMLPPGRKKTRSLPPFTMTDNLSSETEQASSPELEEKAIEERQEHFNECSEWVKDVVNEGWEHESKILYASVKFRQDTHATSPTPSLQAAIVPSNPHERDIESGIEELEVEERVREHLETDAIPPKRNSMEIFLPRSIHSSASILDTASSKSPSNPRELCCSTILLKVLIGFLSLGFLAVFLIIVSHLVLGW